jgi:cytochrome c-type biogenesis protein CcmH/NrfF
MAWIAPYLAIVVAGVVMFTVFRRRASRVEPVELPSGPPATPSAADDERMARLRHEVEELER